MKCYNPVRIIPKVKIGYAEPMLVRCGKCYACKEEIAKEYTARFIHESKYYSKKYFLTLTYSDDNLVLNKYQVGILVKKHITDYIKRVNIHCKRKNLGEYKYFVAGEYGDGSMRPHYHISIVCDNPNILFEFVNEWKYGQVNGAREEATIKSFFYTIGYSDKKVCQVNSDKYFIDNDMPPPFRKFSRGLGSRWYEENKKDLSKQYYLKLGKQRIGLPSYYKKKLKEEELVDLEKLKEKVSEQNRKLLDFYNELYRIKKLDYYDGQVDDLFEIEKRIRATKKHRRKLYEDRQRLKKKRDF